MRTIKFRQSPQSPITTLRVDEIVEIDGQPLDQQSEPNLKDRVIILESVVADLVQFRDAVIQQGENQNGNERSGDR